MARPKRFELLTPRVVARCSCSKARRCSTRQRRGGTTRDALRQADIRSKFRPHLRPEAKGFETAHVFNMPCDGQHFADSPGACCLLYVGSEPRNAVSHTGCSTIKAKPVATDLARNPPRRRCASACHFEARSNGSAGESCMKR